MAPSERWRARREGWRRLSRRRLLASAAATGIGLAGAALLGCGSGGDGSALPSPGARGAGATTTPAAAVMPRQGGAWRLALAADPPTLDPHDHISAMTKTVTAPVYSRLLAYASGPGRPQVNFDTVPDAALTLEAPDAQTYVLRLHPKATFTAPVNRPLTSADVKFSFDRFMGNAPHHARAGDTALLSAVDRVETPDGATVIFRLKEAYGAFAHLLADARALQLMPVETDRAFNPAQTMVGCGPWLFKEYRPGSLVTYARNPTWHLGPDRPYLDALQMSIVREPSAAVSQFLVGDLDTVALQAGEVKRAQASIKGLQVLPANASSIHNITFSGLPPLGPWKDVRVRRAVSMALDRDEMLDAAFGLKELRALGIDLPYRWNGFLPRGITGYWLDPRAMRPEYAAAFAYAPAEAAKLLDAAGVKEGFAADWHYTSGYRGGYHTISELVPRLLKAVKITLRPVVEDYASMFIVQTFAGTFQGLASIAYALGEPGNYLASLYLPGSPRNTGRIDDPTLTSMIQKVQANPDARERRQQLLDAQEYLTAQMYNVPLPVGPTLAGYQPQARNVVDYQSQGYSSAVDQAPHWWKA
ncbi:MAG: ABC transporter substrate-binding protein [Dehalococcoidia bacterium]|nr:ABC transporter substrate-binding protein [Dehalococcoidia bacterium]